MFFFLKKKRIPGKNLELAFACKSNFWHPVRSAVKVTDTDPDDLRTSSKFYFLTQIKVKISRSRKEKAPPNWLFVSSTMATDGDEPSDLSVTLAGSSSHWYEEAVDCLLPIVFYLTDCTSDVSRSSDICELRGSGRWFADVCKIFHVKVALVIVAFRCFPSRANTAQLRGVCM